MNNGFANRFLFVWAESIAEVAFPQATPEHIINDLARETMDVLYFAKGNYPDTQNSHEMSLSVEAKEYYTAIYPTYKRPLSSEFITTILERRAAYLLRLSMLFALTDKTRVIEAHHLKAAKAWIDYAVHSVRYVFQDQAKSAGDEDTRRNAEKIMFFLGRHPEGCTGTAISSDCFKRHLSSEKINKALDYLLTDIPKRIERLEVKSGNPGKKPILYRKIIANNCE